MALLAVVADLAGVLTLALQKWTGGLIFGLIAVILGLAAVVTLQRHPRGPWMAIGAVLIVLLGGFTFGLSLDRRGQSPTEPVASAPPGTAASATTAGTSATRQPSPDPVSASPQPSDSAAADRVPLLDVPLVDDEMERSFTSGAQKVDAINYDDAYTADLLCYVVGQAASDEYQLDRRYRQFTAKVGLADGGTDSGIQVRFTVLLDGAATRSVIVTVGESKAVNVPVTGAFRVALKAEIIKAWQCSGQAKASWLEPTLS